MSNHTVLIVDDEPGNLALLTELLQPHYRVLAATSGERALHLARLPPQPDLILLDVMMPGLDGYGVLKQLREDPLIRHIPVIFVTALADDTNEEQGLQLGAVDYVTKPIRPAIVLLRVQTQLELKRARDRLQAQNNWLEAEVSSRMEEILVIQDVGIHALAVLAETRDPETGFHIQRTQAYVEILARKLSELPHLKDQLDARTIMLMTKSAPLHDIGKVGIPDAILRKPGKLDADEWVVMRTHAQLGAQAIAQAIRDIGRPVAFLMPAMEIAHWHHEKWDGSGYPDGLKGTAIPIAARIMALADVFDALISRRVYKAPMPLSEVIAIITSDSGRHFDPEVVAAFLATQDQFVAVSERYRDPDEAADQGVAA